MTQLKAKKLNPFQEDDQFLKYYTVVMWRAWFHASPGKSSKGFFSRTTRPVNLRSSQRNSPGEALHGGVKNVVLRPPVPVMSEITDTHTHMDTQNTSINIIDDSHVIFDCHFCMAEARMSIFNMLVSSAKVFLSSTKHIFGL